MMRKGLKLGIMALSMLGMFAAILMSSNETEAAATIKLTLSSGGTSSCTLNGIAEFTGKASATSTTASVKTNTVSATCSMFRTGAEYIKITTPDLVGSTSSKTIAKTNLTLKNTCGTANGVSGTCGTTTATAVPSNGIQTLYSKTALTVGSIVLNETYSLTIPAGQVQDVYEGGIGVDVYTSA